MENKKEKISSRGQFTPRELKELRESLDDMHFDEAKRITTVLIGEKGIKQARDALTRLGYKNLGKRGYTPEVRAVFQSWQTSEHGKRNKAILDIGYNGRDAAYGVIGKNGLALLLQMADHLATNTTSGKEVKTTGNSHQNVGRKTLFSRDISQEEKNINNMRYTATLDGTEYISDRQFNYTPTSEDTSLFQKYFPKYRGEGFEVCFFKPRGLKRMNNCPFGFYQSGNKVWIRADIEKNPQEFRNTLLNEMWHLLSTKYRLNKSLDARLKGVKKIILTKTQKQFFYNPQDDHLELEQFGSDVSTVMNASYDDFVRDMETNISLHNKNVKQQKRSEYSLSALLMYEAYRQAEAQYGENGSPEEKIRFIRQTLQKYLQGLLNGGNETIAYLH